MQYERINVGFEQDPKNVNLRLGCTPIERVAFIKLFKGYKDIFAWTYDNVNIFDTKIIQHVILLELYINLYQ